MTTTHQAQPVTIDDTMNCQDTSNMLTDNGYYGKISQEGENYDSHGTTNRILDRRGDRQTARRERDVCARLDQEQAPDSLQVWTSPQGQEKRSGEVYREQQAIRKASVMLAYKTQGTSTLATLIDGP